MPAIGATTPGRAVFAGRNAELTALRREVAEARTNIRLVTIFGPSGVGKSALAAAVMAETRSRGGRAARGKFDQFLSAGAFAAPLQAMAELCTTLLTEPDERLIAVRGRLSSALDDNLDLMTATVPTIAVLLGRPPDPAAAYEVGPEQTERLKLALGLSLRAIATRTEPLVLVLDDVQWADGSTLALLGDLLVADRSPGLCLVITARGPGLDDGTRFARWLAELAADGARTCRIDLGPLSREGTAALVTSMVGTDHGDLHETVRRVQLAAGGNPMHVIEAIRAMHGPWVVPSPQATHESIPTPEIVATTVVDMGSLLEVRLRRLDAHERRLMTVAACTGEWVTPGLLAEVTSSSRDSVDEAVSRLVASALLEMVDRTAAVQTPYVGVELRVAHDQIQAAMRRLTPHGVWKQTHLRISDVLAGAGRHDMRAGIHLAEAVELLGDEAAREAGLDRFVLAAQAARRSAAFEIALQMLALARSLRAAQAWEQRFEATFALEVAWHRALSHLGRYDECDAVYRELMRRALRAIDLVGPTTIQILILQGKSRIAEAIELGMDLLRRVAPELPFEALATDLSDEWDRFRATADTLPLERLADKPLADARCGLVSELLTRIADAGVGDRRGVTTWCSLALFRLWLDQGFHESMPLAPLYLGLHAAAADDHDMQLRLATFGMDVARRRSSPDVRGNVELGYSLLILPWHEPLESSLSMARTAFDRLRAAGDIEMASYAAVAASCVMVETCSTLAQAERYVAPMLEFARRINQSPRAACLAALLGFTGRLRGQVVAAPTRPIGYPYVDVHVFTYAALTSLVMGDTQALARQVDTLEPSIAVHRVMYAGALASFMVCWRDIDRMSGADMPASVDVSRVEARMAWLRRAAQRMPANFAALRHLLEARLAAASGRALDAIASFDEAIRSARSVSRPWQLALILEHAGRFWLSRDLPAFGERLLGEAHGRYRSWGAASKAERLAQEFAFLAVAALPAPLPPRLTVRLDDVDRATLHRALQALSRETDMDRLVERILEIAGQLTGATGAWLLRDHPSSGWQPVGQVRADERLSPPLMRYATRMLRAEVIDDLATDPRFDADPAVARGPRSVLVMPIHDKGVAHAVLLLENHRSPAFFTSAHVDAVQLIAGQLSISLRNAEAYQTLEARVAERTQALQRTATELALRERALASSSNGVHISKLTASGHLVVYANAMLETISGFGADELIGSPIWTLLGSQRTQPAARELREAVEAGRPGAALLRCQRRDATTFWNELSISPLDGIDRTTVYHVGVHKDVSERIRAAEEEKIRTDRLRAVFELSPDGFVVLDSTARISIVNPAFGRMTGLDGDSLMGRTLTEFEHALEKVSAPSGEWVDRGAFANVLPSEPQTDVEAGMGEHGWLLTIAEPRPRTLVRRLRRALSGPETVIYFRDVTRELEVDRMKSEFLSVAAHELRTPMTSIHGFSELLVTGLLPPDDQANVHRIIHKQSSALIGLVGQLLDLARINALQGANFVLRPTSLTAVVREVIGALRGIESSERIVDAMPADDITAVLDADQFHLAVTNVVSNALKYSSTGPVRVDIATRSTSAGRAQAGLRVVDHGVGMSPDQLARLFERFYRANPTAGTAGTGLGATIVRDIMTAHKGEVEVTSELGVGTVVTLWVDRISA